MTIDEKIAFLRERIPSSDAVEALRRRYLFGGVEAALLEDTSQTLLSNRPDEKLIEWAYTLVRLLEEKPSKEKKPLAVQEKVERILALFSNQEDLQRAIQSEDWSPHQKRSIDLVAHFVANDIPLMTNFKIVDKVYHLFENAYLPSDIATRYFGASDRDRIRDDILQRYIGYKEKKQRDHREESPRIPKRESPLKRYAYLLGAATVLATIFMAGFFTAKFFYDRPQAYLNPDATKAIVHPPNKRIDGDIATAENSSLPREPQTLQTVCFIQRQRMEKALKRLGIDKKIDFTTQLARTMIEATGTLPTPKDEGSGPFTAQSAIASYPNPNMNIAVHTMTTLKGLHLPLAHDDNDTYAPLMALPDAFHLEAVETPSTRLVFASDQERGYPLELYTFAGEPSIIQYRFQTFADGHLDAVVSNIWRFSETGRLHTHRHYIYQKNKRSPAKIITDHFLPDGSTIYLVSTRKSDEKGHTLELLQERKEYLPSGKLLLEEEYALDRVPTGWRSRLARRTWYDNGKKITSTTGRDRNLSIQPK